MERDQQAALVPVLDALGAPEGPRAARHEQALARAVVRVGGDHRIDRSGEVAAQAIREHGLEELALVERVAWSRGRFRFVGRRLVPGIRGSFRRGLLGGYRRHFDRYCRPLVRPLVDGGTVFRVAVALDQRRRPQGVIPSHALLARDPLRGARSGRGRRTRHGIHGQRAYSRRRRRQAASRRQGASRRLSRAPLRPAVGFGPDALGRALDSGHPQRTGIRGHGRGLRSRRAHRRAGKREQHQRHHRRHDQQQPGLRLGGQRSGRSRNAIDDALHCPRSRRKRSFRLPICSQPSASNRRVTYKPSAKSYGTSAGCPSRDS